MLEWLTEINNYPTEIKIFGIIAYSIGIPLAFYLFYRLQIKLRGN